MKKARQVRRLVMEAMDLLRDKETIKELGESNPGMRTSTDVHAALLEAKRALDKFLGEA